MSNFLSDYQRNKVYAAERAAFADMPAISWSDAARLTNLWAKCHGINLRGVNMLSKGSRWGGLANPYRMTIAYPNRDSRRWVVAHELAHFIGLDSHGPEFCGQYIRLVKLHIGVACAIDLIRQFDIHGVDYVSSNL